ncbi:type I DNA topoisomerase [Candidatus Gottesmanbacteria bacterium]|nr:type I DNA topoisomerase [Candidatus Gottesmanbacteria bacterium]
MTKSVKCFVINNMQRLVIVESPTKAKTLGRFLGKEYRIEASMGHIRDLPAKKLGIVIRIKNQSIRQAQDKKSEAKSEEYEFVPEYQVIPDRKKRVAEIKKSAENAGQIILATDPDREGEAIAYHIQQLINSASKTNRIVFHEITESAIKEALLHPRAIDMQLVDAQQARRILDRLVGYKLSPILWNKIGRRWLSAGRVQSVTVRLIVEREREIEKFKTEEYWVIDGVFKTDGQELTASLVAKDQIKYEETVIIDLFDGKYSTGKTSIGSQQAAEKIIADFRSPYTVSAVDRKETRRFPSPPFTTSTLQQEAGRRLYFSAKRTMQLAQKLYEEGCITYHRTDSVNLAEKFIQEARTFIGENYGNQYLPEIPRRYKTKSKVAQEAHEAIRPTDIKILNTKFETRSGELNKDHYRLYELIWKRALASQAKEAVFDSTTIDITSSNNYQFEAQGSIVKFEGFLKITGRDNEEKIMPPVTVGQKVDLLKTIPSQHFTSPPPRYTEASLVRTLEEKGIGRPSTYAPIISTIQERQYIVKEEKKLIPTQLGNLVTDFLVKYFPQIMELPFTAMMEDNLDEIANGEKQWPPVISEFYGPFEKLIKSTFEKAQKVKIADEETDEKCPQCNNSLVIRMGRYGKFMACSNYPKCTFTKNIQELAGIICPKCGSQIAVKRTKRGKQFYGCSSYPKCTFAAWKKEDIK